MIKRRSKPQLAAARFTLLAAIAKADGAICRAELRAAEAISGDELKYGKRDPSELFEQMCGASDEEANAAIALLNRRPLAERERTIQLLWIMAICNGDLCMGQEKLIYEMADRLNVSRRTLALQQPDLGMS